MTLQLKNFFGTIGQNGSSLIKIYYPTVCFYKNEKHTPKFVKDTNLLQDIH